MTAPNICKTPRVRRSLACGISCIVHASLANDLLHLLAALDVLPEKLDVAKAGFEAMQERGVNGISRWGERVCLPLSTPAFLHEPRPAQVRKVSRDRRLRHA